MKVKVQIGGLHLNDQVSRGGGVYSSGAGLLILAHMWREQHITHESPPHSSQLVTLKLHGPPTRAWQELERG